MSHIIRRASTGYVKEELDGEVVTLSYPIYALIRCDCGEELELWSFTNECICGELYNSFGQRLAPPDQWDYYDTYE